jgi:hypothetical protein
MDVEDGDVHEEEVLRKEFAVKANSKIWNLFEELNFKNDSF